MAGRDLERELIPMLATDQKGQEGSRRTTFDFPPVNRDRAYDCIDAMRPIAQCKGVSVAQIALAWRLHQPQVTSVIVGAKRPEQLADNLAATQVKLSADELRGLDEVSRPSTLDGCSSGRARLAASSCSRRDAREQHPLSASVLWPEAQHPPSPRIECSPRIDRLCRLCRRHLDGVTGRCGSKAGLRELHLDAVDLPVELKCIPLTAPRPATCSG